MGDKVVLGPVYCAPFFVPRFSSHIFYIYIWVCRKRGTKKLGYDGKKIVLVILATKYFFLCTGLHGPLTCRMDFSRLTFGCTIIKSDLVANPISQFTAHFFSNSSGHWNGSDSPGLSNSNLPMFMKPWKKQFYTMTVNILQTLSEWSLLYRLHPFYDCTMK